MVILQYLSTCVAVPVLRRTRPDLPRTVRLPLGPVIPALGALLLLGVLSQVGRVDLELTAATVLAGVVLAVAWRAARPARAA